MTENNVNNEESISIKDMYVTAISYLLIAIILENVTSEIILNLSEQIAVSQNISKEYFISTFDLNYIFDIINEIINQFTDTSSKILIEISESNQSKIYTGTK